MCGARVAKQQAQRYATHFKVNSEEFRKLAARTSFPEIQARRLRITASNERLSNIAEGVRIAADAKGYPVPPEPLKRSNEAAGKRTEDPVSQARRPCRRGGSPYRASESSRRTIVM
jgi:hypothetical protein